MWWKSLGLSCALGVFVGCGADPGTEGNELPAVSEVTSAATGCQSFVGTISDQVAAGRAFEQDTQFLIWTLPAYYATGGTELIGSSPTQTVTLYPKTGGGFTANASLCEASVCGDGILQSPAEACDGTAFPSGSAPAGGTPACSQYSDQYVAGNVSCTADCKVDFSACRKSVCGDGKAEGTEQCDGSDLGGFQTCQDNVAAGAFTGGQLKCKSDCTYDVSSCITACGNGKLDPGEDCDGPLLGPTYAGKTCASFTNPSPVFPFSNTVPYAAGPLPCDNQCKVNTNLCAYAPGCYYVYTAQKTLGIQCH